MKYTIVEYNAYWDALDKNASSEYLYAGEPNKLQVILDSNSDKIFCGFVPTIEKNKYHLVFREADK